MSSIEENQCIDPSFLVSEYPEDFQTSGHPDIQTNSSSPVVDIQTSGHPDIQTNSSPAYSGNQCTPDTYVDASDFTPIKPSDRNTDSYALQNNSPLPRGEGVGGRVETSPVAALGAWCFLCGCAPVSPGANPNGDGGFDFGDDDAGTDERTDVRANDSDNDGYPEDKDCDDNNATIHPRAEETPYDGIDQDCNGEDVIDADEDGFIATQAGGNDCNDDQAYIHPGAEQRLTGFDTNCDDSLEIDLTRDAVTFVGENVDNQPGHHAIALGDLNGDGYDDVIVGVKDKHTDISYDYAGRVYVFFGGADALPLGATLNLDEADVQINGACGWSLGMEVFSKDLDSDGKAELLVGVPGFNNSDCDPPYNAGDASGSGAVLVFQGRSAWEPAYDFYAIDAWNEGDLSSSQVGVVTGSRGDAIGGRFSVTGDIDGNGEGEIIAGRSSSCNVIPARAYTGIQDIETIRETEGGYQFYDNTGSPFTRGFCDEVASGDIDDDGFEDLAFFGADEEHSPHGEVVLLMGGANIPAEMNFFTISSYAGLRHLGFIGNGPGVIAGSGGIVSIGDLNGDGMGELLISMNGENDPMERAGRVYCLPGSSLAGIVDGDNPLFGNGDTLTLNGDVYDVGGKSFHGDVENALIGTYGLTAASDTNNDGARDLVVGAALYGEGFGATTPGKSFYFDGLPHSTSPDAEISVADAEHRITGKEPNLLGIQVFGGGDVNGDGAQEVVITAPGTATAYNEGRSYLLFGGVR